jgi:hypothetical protein
MIKFELNKCSANLRGEKGYFFGDEYRLGHLVNVFMRTFVVVVAMLAKGLFSSMLAQDSTLDKPVERWTKEEARIILNNSPWVITQEVRIRYAGESRPVAGGPSPTTGTSNRSEQNSISSAGAEAPVDFQFMVRLRSALPIRQALMRIRQLEAKSEKMSDKERADFDAKTKGLLECPPCVDNYVLTLSSKSAQNPGADAVYAVFKGARLEDLKRYIYIANEQGERRPLIHFVSPKVPGEEAIFFFPRFDDKNVPLLTSENKELLFSLTSNEINIITSFRVSVSKLVRNGKVEF